jgi:pyruvate formate lyase activating enzyme
MGKCKICKKEDRTISSFLSLCANCIKENFSQLKDELISLHKKVKERFGIFYQEKPQGLICDLCVNQCKLKEKDISFCGLRTVRDNQLIGPDKNFANLDYYFDHLPTNCVASFCCAAAGFGFPEFSYTEKEEYGYKNLAVFFNACSFNCLFCQNYSYHWRTKNKNLINVEDLLEVIDEKTSCVCFFGGDPATHIDFTINFSYRAIKSKKNRILRICWETNGSFNPRYQKDILDILLKTGGTIKFDLKFYSPQLNFALCGRFNKLTLENFSFFAKNFSLRKKFSLVCASTLIIPGYINEEEIEKISSFIAQFDKEIPYSLLGFWPQFYLKDLPPTSWNLMKRCYKVAKKFLKNVNMANIHLLC